MNISDCDKEPIHLIGSMQGHGLFLTLAGPELRVRHVSENCLGFLGLPAQAVVGQRLVDILGEEMSRKTSETAASENFLERGRGAFWVAAEAPWDAYLFRLPNLLGLELESGVADPAAPDIVPGDVVTEFVDRFRDSGDTLEMARHLCRVIRRLSGLERVMLYKFTANWDGEVIAEDRVADSHSFLAHRFPASDIPAQVRALYQRNEVRLIRDSHDESSPIYPRVSAESRAQLDLSDSRLRAVSPIHLEYLRNMGVRSSLSIAISIRGRLWGLVACHSAETRAVSQSARSAGLALAQCFAARVGGLESEQIHRDEVEMSRALRQLVVELARADDPVARLMDEGERVQTIFACAGLAYVAGERVESAGLTPPASDIASLAQALRQRMTTDGDTSVAIEQLSELDPKWSALRRHVSGVLAHIEEPSSGLLMLFRPELERTIVWSGNPQKTLSARNYPGQLQPRASFESWRETLHGHALPWAAHQAEGLAFLHSFLSA